MSGTGKVIVVMLVAVVALSVGEALMARGMNRSNRVVGSWWVLVSTVARDGYVLSGAALLLVYLVLSLVALRAADLSYVLPLTALSYPLGALLAQFYLDENVNWMRWLGTLVITAGVAIVGFGQPSEPR